MRIEKRNVKIGVLAVAGIALLGLLVGPAVHGPNAALAATQWSMLDSLTNTDSALTPKSYNPSGGEAVIVVGRDVEVIEPPPEPVDTGKTYEYPPLSQEEREREWEKPRAETPSLEIKEPPPPPRDLNPLNDPDVKKGIERHKKWYYGK